MKNHKPIAPALRLAQSAGFGAPDGQFSAKESLLASLLSNFLALGSARPRACPLWVSILHDSIVVGARRAHEGAGPGGHRQHLALVGAQKYPVVRDGFLGQLHDRNVGILLHIVRIIVISGVGAGIPGKGLDLEGLQPNIGAPVDGFNAVKARVPIGARSDHGDRRHRVEPRRQGNVVELLRLSRPVEGHVSLNGITGE